MKSTRNPFLVAMAIVAICATVLAGCAAPAPAPTPTPAPKPVTIRHAVFVAPSLVELNEELAKKFHELHPNITVKIELVSFEDYLVKMQVDLAAGTAADVIYINPSINFPLVAYKGFVLPLDEYVKRDNYDLSDLHPLAVETARFDGKLYAIAQEAGAGEPTLYFNKALFDEAGIPYPTDDWTYDDLLEAAQKLTKDTDGDGKIDQYGIIPPYERRHLSNNTLVRSFGGGWVSDDGTTSLANKLETIEAVQFMADLVNVYQVSPLQPEQNQEATFGTGKIGMINGALFSQIFLTGSVVEEHLGWVLMPKGKAGMIAGGAGFGGLGITTTSEHPDEAWEWIKFLCSPENIRRYAALGFQPARNSIGDELMASNPGFIPFYMAMKNAKPSGTSTANLRDAEVLDLLNQALGDVWAGKRSAKDVLNEVQPKLQAILNMPRP